MPTPEQPSENPKDDLDRVVQGYLEAIAKYQKAIESYKSALDSAKAMQECTERSRDMWHKTAQRMSVALVVMCFCTIALALSRLL